MDFEKIRKSSRGHSTTSPGGCQPVRATFPSTGRCPHIMHPSERAPTGRLPSGAGSRPPTTRRNDMRVIGRLLALTTLALALAPVAAGEKGAKGPLDPASLTGTWVYVSGEKDGQKVPAENL